MLLCVCMLCNENAMQVVIVKVCLHAKISSVGIVGFNGAMVAGVGWG